MTTELLVHARAQLALHTIRDGVGRPLLHLHGLGERTPDSVPDRLSSWSGPVFGLDFVGHGGSTLPRGGGYTAEVLMADVDTALRSIGEATLFGRGVGAYVALLAAGARPDLVRGAVLADGPGLAGGGPQPGSSSIVTLEVGARGPTPDAYALLELSRDVRPPDYAMTYVRHAVEFGAFDDLLVVTTVVRPEWLTGILGEPGVVERSVADALALYAD
ncbi:MAG: alpha/beta hydrolase [Acidimicrobiia bacterium]|nr:alpha/beta hydrolase [Acidimicrobiia bacterium]